jgi:hypothetical protein
MLEALAAADGALERLIVAPITEHRVQARRPAGRLIGLRQDLHGQPEGALYAPLRPRGV